MAALLVAGRALQVVHDTAPVGQHQRVVADVADGAAGVGAAAVDHDLLLREVRAPCLAQALVPQREARARGDVRLEAGAFTGVEG